MINFALSPLPLTRLPACLPYNFIPKSSLDVSYLPTTSSGLAGLGYYNSEYAAIVAQSPPTTTTKYISRREFV